MKLNTDKWEYFKLTKLFEVTGTRTTKKDDLQEVENGDYPYVTTGSMNNGVAGGYSFFTEKGNVLTIESACKGFCTYQEKNFTASDHVEKLIPLFEFNLPRAMFFVTILNMECCYYSYGRKCNQMKIKNREIKLPICRDEYNNPIIDNSYKYSEKGYIPDFRWIETYIKRISVKSFNTANNSVKISCNWK